jgi:hypothetical protein
MVAIVIFILLGCQTLQPDQSIASGTGGTASSTMTKSKQGDFSAVLSLPQKAKVYEVFTMKAELKKQTTQKITIQSRQKMFTFLIKDRSGKQINSYAIKDSGLARVISGKAVIPESYEYKIKKPGIYEVSAIAEFSVIENGKSKDFIIETEPKKIEIAP